MFKDYTVDFRLKQFRRVHSGECVCGMGEIEFIDFDSGEGVELLTEIAIACLTRPK